MIHAKTVPKAGTKPINKALSQISTQTNHPSSDSAKYLLRLRVRDVFFTFFRKFHEIDPNTTGPFAHHR